MDEYLFRAVNQRAANSAFDWLMPRITNLHHALWFIALVVIVSGALVWRGGRWGRTALICVIAAVSLSDLLCTRVLKHLIQRDRPCYAAPGSSRMSYPSTRLLPGHGAPAGYRSDPRKDCPGSPSFPSNHASNMMALAGTAWWFSRGRIRYLWFLLPLVIGFSRVYIGVHYPSDVLGGWITGALIACGCALAGRRALRPTPARSEGGTDG